MEGRVLRTGARCEDRCLTVSSVHDFDLAPDQMIMIERTLRAVQIESSSELTKRAAFAAGDWSFCADGEGGFAMKAAEKNFRSAPAPSGRQSASLRWQRILSEFTDIHSSHRVRWSQATLAASRLGRLCVCLLGWLLLNSQTAACALGDPLLKQLRGLSDRVPISIIFSHKPPPKGRSLHTPTWVCKSHLFAPALEKVAQHLKFDKLSGVRR